MLGILIAGTVLGVLVVIFAERGTSLAARMTRCSMGFFVSIVWIMAIADEVVSVLQVRAYPSVTGFLERTTT
jgi:sodium/potassium/calcium exchanger 6